MAGEANDSDDTSGIFWPGYVGPESGRIRKFPEIDRAAFFGLDEARIRIKPTQVPLIDRLEALVSPGGPRRAR